jgi:hypothetical protein
MKGNTAEVYKILQAKPNGCTVNTIYDNIEPTHPIRDNDDPKAYIRGILSYLKKKGKVECKPLYGEWPHSPKKWSVI